MFDHRWDLSIPEATVLQKTLREAVRLVPLKHPIRTIAGADISFSRHSDIFHGCIVVFSYPDLVEIDRAFATLRVQFPYVPGYLSFREVPVLVEAYQKLPTKPDLIVMDGHGIAHPRRLGVATHLGLALDVPTIGCAKTRLYGIGNEPGAAPESIAILADPRTGEHLGSYLRTKRNARPIIISPGFRVTHADALRVVRDCLDGYRLPRPTRRAHILVNQYRRSEIRDA